VLPVVRNAGRDIVNALWVIVLLGAIGGALQLGQVLTATEIGAPQQAAGAAIAAALAIIPYCFVRAIQFMAGSPSERELKRINEALATHTKLLAEVANKAALEAPPPPKAATAIAG
jgi:hypothetical protein